jgi:hypothetical protein
VRGVGRRTRRETTGSSEVGEDEGFRQRQLELDPRTRSNIVVGNDALVTLHKTVTHEDFDEARRKIRSGVEHAE